jgi:ABC-type bacteriocin/lantibiotic exporter with double-glycine peptidase domain
LARAAETCGVELLSRYLSVQEAIAFVEAESPLALFTLLPNGTARWFVLAESRGGYVRFNKIHPSDTTEWLTSAELAKQLGAEGPDAVLEWHFARPQSVAPTQDRSHHDDDHHGGGHGHGHGHAHMSPFRRLLTILQPESKDLVIVFFFAIGVGVFTLATPIVAMAMVNTVALGTLVQQLFVLCLALLIALAVAGLLQILQTYTVEYIQRRVFVRVADDLATRLPRVDLCGFDRQHGPELVNRFFDVLTVQKAAATLLLDGITIALQVLIGLLLLGFYHIYLFGFDLVLLASLTLIFTVLGRGAVRTAVRESIAKYAVAGSLEEIARHPAAFKTAGGPQLARDRVDALTREYLLARTAHFRILVRQLGFSLLLQAAANVSLLGIGGALVIRGELTLGELVAAEVVVTLVVATFTKLYKQLEAYYDLLAAVDKLGHLIDLPLERDSGSDHLPRPGGAKMDVINVSFGYEGSGRNALNNLSLTLLPGERVALVGPNGAGKSTLVDILFGLRNPHSGRVEIDGVDIRALRLDAVREQIAVVKGIEVVGGTVLDNVRMGRDEITLGDAREALRAVGLIDAILELPDGLDTVLWTGGSPLSQGQATRLMIARALAGRPRLLILDEALDQMGVQAREDVLPHLMGSHLPWTVLLITHFDALASRCDRIITLERAHGHHDHHHAASGHHH